VDQAARSALVIVICLLAGACASAPAPRPLASGFGAEAGVADPYADGKRHLAEGNYELAAQRFGQALAHDGRSLDALNGLGVAYTRLRRFDSAETQFERALQIEPTNAATMNNYGWSLIEQGRLRQARAFLELARRHATAAEAPVIAANLRNLGNARPPALLDALEEGSGPQTPPRAHRLMRVADNAYVLETTAEPAKPSAPPSAAPRVPVGARELQQDTAAIALSEEDAVRPDVRSALSVAAQGAGATAAPPAPPEQSRAAEPEPEVPIKPHARGGPIRLWPPLAFGSEAGAITAGDEE
jgi:tetratricopeptide (TPR) repeat protein